MALALAILAATGCREAPDHSGAEPVSGRDVDGLDAVRGRVYVSNADSGDISIIDSASDRVVGTIPIGKRPRGMRLSADGKLLYVSARGSVRADQDADAALTPSAQLADGIALVDTLAQRVVRVLPSSLNSDCFDLSPDERHIYLGPVGAHVASMFELATGKLRHALPVRGAPEGVSARPDGGVVYVASARPDVLTVVDAQSPRVLATLPSGPAPGRPIFSPDGLRAFVASAKRASVRVIDARRHQVLSDILLPDTRARAVSLALSPDGQTLFASGGLGQVVYIIDVASARVVSQVEDVGARPRGLGLTSDGRKLYVANGPSDDVAIVDVHKGRVVARVQVGHDPHDIVVAP